MRFDGVIKSWDDVRGAGTIQPLPDGDDIAVHITAFARGQARPRPKLRVSFEVELAHDGTKRASAVRIHESVRAARAPSRHSHTQRSPAVAVALIALALGGYAAAAYYWHAPPSFGITFVALGLLTFAAAARDKVAAKSRHARLPDGLWLLLALAGGWAGLLLAPSLLGHTPGRRLSVWMTRLAIAVHVLATVLLVSPYGRAWR